MSAPSLPPEPIESQEKQPPKEMRWLGQKLDYVNLLGLAWAWQRGPRLRELGMGRGAHEFLMSLAAHTDFNEQTGKSHPGEDTIAAETGFSESGTKLALSRLKEAGVVKVVRVGGRNNHYTIQPERDGHTWQPVERQGQSVDVSRPVSRPVTSSEWTCHSQPVDPSQPVSDPEYVQEDAKEDAKVKRTSNTSLEVGEDKGQNLETFKQRNRETEDQGKVPTVPVTEEAGHASREEQPASESHLVSPATLTPPPQTPPPASTGHPITKDSARRGRVAYSGPKRSAPPPASSGQTPRQPAPTPAPVPRRPAASDFPDSMGGRLAALYLTLQANVLKESAAPYYAAAVNAWPEQLTGLQHNLNDSDNPERDLASLFKHIHEPSNFWSKHVIRCKGDPVSWLVEPQTFEKVLRSWRIDQAAQTSDAAMTEAKANTPAPSLHPTLITLNHRPTGKAREGLFKWE